jgi:hypothetical protein
MVESCFRQWIVFTSAPNSALVLSITEKLGRSAGVGYWLAGIGDIGMECFSSPFSIASF